MHGIVTFIAKYFIVLSVVGAIVVWLRLDKRRKLQFIVVGIIGAVLTVVLAKLGSHIYYDTRPFVVGHFTPYFSHGNDNGFPSDHTLLAGFLATLSWFYSKRAGAALAVVAVLIGLSRVIAGVHHLIDIVGSLVFAAVGTWLAYAIVSAWSKRNSHLQANDKNLS